MKKADLVFITSPGIGHLVSTVKLSNLLLERNEELSIIVLVTEKGKEHIPKLATNTNIRLIELSYVEPPPDELRIKCIEKYGADAIEAHKDCVKDARVKKILPNSPKLLGLVVDFFCSSMIDVANELGLPFYLFFTSSVAFLGFTLHIAHRFDQVGREFEESDPESIAPGYINPVPANVLPNFAFNKDGYISFVNHGRKFRETKGIVVNSFIDLESLAVSSLSTHDLLLFTLRGR